MSLKSFERFALHAAALGAMAVLLAACASPESNDEDSAGSAEPTVYEIPEGCPSAEDFGLAWSNKDDLAVAIDLAILSNEVSVALPEGGCAYAAQTPGTDQASGNSYREIFVAYFNLDEPERQSTGDMRAWADVAGATSGSPEEGFGLPTDFSGWSGAEISWFGQWAWLRPDAIPAFVQGTSGLVNFALDASRVDTIEAASAAAEGSVDPTTALAQGLAAPYSATFTIKDTEGYTAEVEVTGRLQPWTADVASAPPGEFDAVSSSLTEVTYTNTTSDRNGQFPYMSVVALYPVRTAPCNGFLTLTAEDGSGYCYVIIFRESGVDLGPSEVKTIASTNTPLGLGSFPESGPGLSELNTPVSLYVMYGGKGPNLTGVDWTSEQGCSVFAGTGGQSVVVLEGWPNVLCD